MGKKILESKALFVFLSIVVAIILWFYVTSLDGNQHTKTIKNVPVTFTGIDTLEARSLMIVGDVPTATIEVKAAPTVLAKLTDTTMRAVVNVSQITEAAEYTLAYTAALPSGITQSQVEIVSGYTGNITFTVARYSSREVEIRGQFTGTAAPGYMPGNTDEFIFAPGKLTISGQSNLVNQVAYALVTVDNQNLEDSVSGNYAYELIGANGEPLKNLDVTCDVDRIYVTYPIWATADLKLDVKFNYAGGVCADTMDYTLSTDHITVAGTKADIAGITDRTLTLATINLATVHDGDELRFAIPLADELNNLTGISEVTVTIHLDSNLVTTTVGAEDISLINIPDGWKATLVTQILPVEVRGTEGLMGNLVMENVRVVVDLKDANVAPGQFAHPAKIYLDSSGSADQIGIVGTDYKVVVALSKK